MSDITYRMDCDGVDWQALKDRLIEDEFDNFRTPAQYRISFNNSERVIFAWDGDQIVGKARAISDGVCNAYVVDVWTYTPYRKRGIAKQMMDQLVESLPGQHVYLFTDDAMEFYEKIGFQRQGVGLYKMSGEWLQNDTRNVE